VRVLSLFGALLVFVASMLGHAAVCRMPSTVNAVFRFIFVASVLGIALSLWLYMTFGFSSPQLWSGLLSYALFCELYVFLFTLAKGSISANLLVNLSQCHIMDADIDHLYDSGSMVAARIDRMVALGLLEEACGVLVLTNRGSRLIRAFGRLRAFFHHPPLSEL
jgi:hypothetical protein